MRLAGKGACVDHRAALLDFVDGRERERVPRAALAHLDRCSTCEREMTELALTVAALRRLAGDIADAEPTTAWPALLARIDGRAVVTARRPSAFAGLLFRAGISGMLTVGIVVASIALGHVARPDAPLDRGPAIIAFDPATTVEITVDRGRTPARTVEIDLARTTITPTAWSGPDGLGVPRGTRIVLHRPNAAGGAI